MGKGRKKLPTQLKKIRGTLDKSRAVKNEMQVSSLSELPSAPEWLRETAQIEWCNVTNELLNLQMLHKIDLILLAAYCNAISLHIELEQLLMEKGRVNHYYNEDGSLRHSQSKPEVKISNDSLANALKIAVQFGFTPSSRGSISAPKITNTTQINYFD
jgi:P27 family predicted phage terminase small subunit